MRGALVLRAPRSDSAGFTLVEMMAVLVIIALAAALFVPLLQRGGQASNADAVASDIRTLLLSARLGAIVRGQTETVTVDLPRRQIRHGTNHAISIPELLQPRLLIGRELLEDSGEAEILFFSDGGSSGAEIGLIAADGRVIAVRISWLTGLPVVMRPK